ncbi:MAG: hypothetical protein ABII85_00290 [Bacillota bacterium]
MKKNIVRKSKLNKKKPVMHASRMLNTEMTLENFTTNRQLMESSLRNVFSKFENENNPDKQVVFY